MGSLVAVLAALGVALAPPRPTLPTLVQDNRARFEVLVPTDTTFSILLGGARWVSAGMSGIVVDPAARDELVARFRVVQVGERTAAAVITGATRTLTESHMALLQIPRKPWYQERLFWIGAVVGVALGVIVGGT